MGLHLCYELSLPADRSDGDVLGRVDALRERALALPFDRVSDVVRFDERALAEAPPMRGLAYESLAHVVQLHAGFLRDELYRDWLGLGEEDEYEIVDERTRVYRPIEAPPNLPTSVVGFAIAPGRGSEPATVALTRLCGPRTATRWWDHCCCKTQYASALGDEHLLRCHGSLVALLDAAREIGFEVEVRDETGYWESRDPDALVERVNEMNRVVARVAGAITDAVRRAGGDSRQLQGAIFSHPDFERLETEQSDNVPGA
jgi:hypothetical protein